MRKMALAVGYLSTSTLCWALLSTGTTAGNKRSEEVRVSTEAVEPYADGLRPPSRFTNAQKAAVQQYTSTIDCLSSAEQQSPHPDFGQFDWNSFRTEDALDVCIFRLASSLKSVDRTRRWFEEQGFRVALMDSYNINAEFILSAHWDVKKFGTRFPTHGFSHNLSRLYAYDQVITVRWKSDGSIFDVDVALNLE